MAITLADKHRGQGRRLRVPVGELPINTQAFSLMAWKRQSERDSAQAYTEKKCIIF